jgi:hypothetical protein
MAKLKTNKILFTEKKVEGYTIKPFTLGIVEELAPTFEKIGMALIGKGVTIVNVSEQIPKVMSSILPEISELLSIVLKEDKEVIKDFPMDKALTIVLTILTQNLTYLKNSFSPLSLISQALTKKD